MAVAISVSPLFYPVPTADRRLPIAMWLGRQALTGDGSGTTATITIVLPFKGNSLYSLEDFAAESSDGTTGYEI